MAQTVQLLGTGAGGERLPPDLRGALLAYLAYADDWLPREQVAFMFWPDTDEAGARRNLRQLLNRTKSLKLTTALEVESTQLRWPVSSDVAQLRRAVGRQQWDQVIALYSGDLLAGRPAEANASFGAWLDLERENLRNVYRRAVGRRAEELEAQTDHAAAAAVLEPLLAGDELDEELLQAFMRNAYLAGQRSHAVQAYERFAQQLAHEVGLEPLPETRSLLETITSAAPLAGAPARRAPAAPLQVQRPPRLVGRDSSLAQVIAAPTNVVLLSGEAGVGKTRLMEELTERRAAARCLEGLQSVPFQSVVDLVRGALRGGWSPEQLGDYREDLARLVPETLPGTNAPPAEPLTLRSRLLEALARCLESAYGSGAPGAGAGFHLTIDDLQWADDDTLELLTLLAHRGRLRVLGAFRRYETTERLERFLSGLHTAGLLTLVSLEPLSEEQVRDLLATLIGAPQGPERFAKWLHGSSAGNVMFALETLKSLFENGVLAEGNDGWRSELDAITRDYSELEAPRAIADVVGRRLSRLSAEGVRAAHAAAVLGAGITPTLLAAMLDCSELAAQDLLEELERGGMLLGHEFRHDLIRQSVYGSLTQGRRRLLHARAAEALTPRTRSLAESESLIVVGEHQLAAGDPAAGARTLTRAATDLQEAGLVTQASTVLGRTLQRLQRGEHGDDAGLPSDHAAVTHVKIGLVRNLIMLGELDKAAPLLDEALRATLPPELRAEALEAHAKLLLRSGRLDEALAAARAAMDLATRHGDRVLAINASTAVAEAAYYLGRLTEALEIVEANVRSLRSEDLPLALASQLTSQGAILDVLERSQEALPAHVEALDIARSLGARHQFVNVALNLLECYRILKRHDEALSVAEEALALGEVDGTSVLRNNLASMLMELGRLDEAAQHCRANLDVEDPTIRVLAWARLVTLSARSGDEGAMREALAGTLEHAHRSEFPVARVSAATSLFDHGDDALRRSALELVAELDPAALEASHKDDVLRIRQHFED
ncbi:MAG: AAA family ATPase [Trueperaceae bacterium]